MKEAFFRNPPGDIIKRVVTAQARNPNRAVDCYWLDKGSEILASASFIPHALSKIDIGDVCSKLEGISILNIRNVSEKSNTDSSNPVVVKSPSLQEALSIVRKQARYPRREIVLFWRNNNNGNIITSIKNPYEYRKAKGRRGLRSLALQVKNSDGVMIRERIEKNSLRRKHDSTFS